MKLADQIVGTIRAHERLEGPLSVQEGLNLLCEALAIYLAEKGIALPSALSLVQRFYQRHTARAAN